MNDLERYKKIQALPGYKFRESSQIMDIAQTRAMFVGARMEPDEKKLGQIVENLLSEMFSKAAHRVIELGVTFPVNIYVDMEYDEKKGMLRFVAHLVQDPRSGSLAQDFDSDGEGGDEQAAEPGV